MKSMQSIKALFEMVWNKSAISNGSFKSAISNGLENITSVNYKKLKKSRRYCCIITMDRRRAKQEELRKEKRHEQAVR